MILRMIIRRRLSGRPVSGLLRQLYRIERFVFGVPVPVGVARAE